MRLAFTPWMPAVARPAHTAHPVVTPTRLPGLAAALRRGAMRWRDAVRAEPLPQLDSATLRDLGLSHLGLAGHGADPHAARRTAAAD